MLAERARGDEFLGKATEAAAKLEAFDRRTRSRDASPREECN